MKRQDVQEAPPPRPDSGESEHEGKEIVGGSDKLTGVVRLTNPEITSQTSAPNFFLELICVA